MAQNAPFLIFMIMDTPFQNFGLKYPANTSFQAISSAISSHSCVVPHFASRKICMIKMCISPNVVPETANHTQIFEKHVMTHKIQYLKGMSGPLSLKMNIFVIFPCIEVFRWINNLFFYKARANELY